MTKEKFTDTLENVGRTTNELKRLRGGLLIAEKASLRIIINMKKLLLDALEYKKWSRVAELESYISGCEQIKMVYEMAIKKSELKDK